MDGLLESDYQQTIAALRGEVATLHDDGVALCSQLIALRSDLTAVTAERDRMREALVDIGSGPLHHIEHWANAYPEDVFIEPTKEEWAAINELLKENGYNMTAFNGSVARHCVQGIQGYAKEAMHMIDSTLEEGEECPQS